MESPYGDEKKGSVQDHAVHEPLTTKPETWVKKTTNFLAHWGIETNGWVSYIVPLSHRMADPLSI